MATKTPTKSSPLQGLLAGLLSTVITLLITFGLIEFSFRIHDGFLEWRYGKSNTEAFLHDYDPQRGWKNKPGASEYYVNKEGRIRAQVQINSKGLRDEELFYEKPAGTKRILLLDASAIAGFEVESKDTVDTVLEQRLASQGKFQVLNGATRAYGTDQNLLFLKEEGVKYQPDFVIYTLFEEDFEDNLIIHKKNKTYGKSYFIINSANELELKGTPVPQEFPSDKTLTSHPLEQAHFDAIEKANVSATQTKVSPVKNFFYDHSLFYRWVTTRIKQTKMNQMLRQTGLQAQNSFKKSDALIDAEYALTERLIAEMKAVSEKAGARFALYEFANGNPENKPSARLQQMADRLKVDLIHSSDRFVEASQNGRSLRYAEGHWNAGGHQLAAEILQDYISKQVGEK